MGLKRMKMMARRVLVSMICLMMVASTNLMQIIPYVEAAEESNIFLLPSVEATASGYAAAEPPSEAIDGDGSSKWSYETGATPPSADNPYWLKLDAGATATISRFEIKHAGAGGEQQESNTSDYTIEVSDDDVNWEPVVTVTGNVYDETVHPLSEPVSARYFKLNITDPANSSDDSYAANIYEFQAYGYMEEPVAIPTLTDSNPIASDSQWSYLDDGSDQGTTWRAVDFNDSAWAKGAAPLGYASTGKDQNLKTKIQYGDSKNKHITTYYRKEFQVTDAAAIKQLLGTLIRDDGAVIYLNGQEVYRTNMPDGAITYTILAASAVGDERDENSFAIDPALLVDGKNVITAEVHQNAGSSSDTFFALELSASDEEVVQPANDQGLLAEYYTNSGGDFAFGAYKATRIDPQINFKDLEGALSTWTGQNDNANIRWTGQIVPEFSEPYTFSMIGDNGFRLSIDGKTVIDHWDNDWDVEYSSDPITLEAGRKYEIKIEYFEDYGGSNLYLHWESPSVAKEIVPAEAFYLPADYDGPISGTIAADGKHVELTFLNELSAVPDTLAEHVSVTVGEGTRTVTTAELSAENASVLQLELKAPILTTQLVNVQYDGSGGLAADGQGTIGTFAFSPLNQSVSLDYSPISIAMSFYGSPKTNRSFAWYTKYDKPENAPKNAKDSIVEVIPAGGDFDTSDVMRFAGEPEDTKVLDLKITNSTRGSFISHKVLVTGLTPGTAYKYRVGSDDNWSDVGSFTTEAEDEQDYEFLYMTDSQGANTHDYEVWADTLGQGLNKFPDSKFLVMTGDMVDAGALEYQWLDYFEKPQDKLLNLPLMTAVGNHEGPYNDNYYYHFYYPNDSIDDPLPPGSVYSYDYGDAHFMVINTMDMGWDNRQRESFKQQIEWLKREVAQTDKKWKVVAFHKAIYSVGGHSDEAEIYELRDMLVPVFDELGIDVVLQGHDHTYMRSHQMYGDKAVTDIEKDEGGNPVNPDGTMYIVNNSAGTKYYDVNEGLNKYYAAAFEQPRKPVYTGIKMTEDSFTLESYRSGEEVPFDAYTIVRNDSKPASVQGLTASETGDGKTVLAWQKPENGSAEDVVRGFRIYEANGKMGRNWSVYVPAVEGLTSYQYTVEGTKSGQDYVFAVTAVDKRDNSPASTISTDGNVPAAPTLPVVNDGYNTFGWTNVPGYAEPADYEYSVDGGSTWKDVTANPQPVGDADYAAGTVMVRVKANEAAGTAAGLPLASDKPFTANSVHHTYSLTGTLTREKGLKVEVEVEQLAEYSGEAYVVFELLNGDTPLLINAIPVKQSKLPVAQYFNVSGANYRVKVFVFDEFNSDLDIPAHLAEPVEFR
ncbi:PA14 domain-containing protein [Paenibacillus sp. P96]|uniref:PA14 domain-containing protein n=1 Tax=Paenibacillus zeirhizosphaerae TaxID=2987519 RepID=A0ABT9FQM0_9BACL|nr:PA14 domain-containing protein [Paenibacillus sp. P96]MDP4097011.1 PA14 domain-containing protein [Paenibacillus sp. P96]